MKEPIIETYVPQNKRLPFQIAGGVGIAFIVGLLFYLILLKNNQEISVGDIAFVFSLTYIFSDSSWKMIVAIKDFTKDLANFKSSFSIMQNPQNPIDKADAKELVI
jgi:ATP-binding cassette subfamily B protein